MSDTELALDERLMGHALAAARGGRPSPNPHVGAVVVQGEEVISVGHHARAGDDHAEVAALKAAGAAARGATVYCTLEPCNHFGRTPPCTDALIEAGVARVVIGCTDPAPHVPGAIAKLVNAGLGVMVGVREGEARALIADFTRHITTGLPYAILKAAVTLDGRTAARTGDARWITGEPARARAHAMRAQADAVLVGVGTVLADDPALTVRHVEGVDPTRVVIDTHLRTPPGCRLVEHASPAPTWIVHGPEAPAARRADLAREGVELIEARLRDGRVDLTEALAELGRRDVVRLLVEGGPRIHGALLSAGLFQRAAVFVAPRLLGDPEALPLAFGGPVDEVAGGYRLLDPAIERLGDDVLIEGDLFTP